ncbi:Phosphate acetyltransferase [subsurface metagenome]
MNFIEIMRSKAKNNLRKLVLPEGTEPRTLKAAEILVKEGLVSSLTLLGREEEIYRVAEKEGCDLTGIILENPENPELSERRDEFTQEYFNLRKHKGISLENARKQITDNLYWGAMMVRKGVVHTMVAGAENSTGDVLRAALKIIKTSPGTRIASSCYVMYLPGTSWGAEGYLIFSDCATVPDPNSEELAEIALAASDSCRTFLGVEPITALLSFSTKGSAKHPAVDKVTRALEIVKTERPELKVDGELQLDAAIIAAIGQKKAPDSTVAGNANVLVFPDLNSGNIGYKLVQRLASAEAYGPFLQGFAKPVSDLSRGCSVDDIVNTSVVTLVQAQKQQAESSPVIYPLIEGGRAGLSGSSKVRKSSSSTISSIISIDVGVRSVNSIPKPEGRFSDIGLLPVMRQPESRLKS